MASNDEALNINSLPDEMLTNIFSLLSQNELGRIASSKEFASIRRQETGESGVQTFVNLFKRAESFAKENFDTIFFSHSNCQFLSSWQSDEERYLLTNLKNISGDQCFFLAWILLFLVSLIVEKEQKDIESVCRRWNVLTKDPVFWKEVNVEFHWSHKSQNTVTMSLVKMLPSCVTCIRLDFRHFCCWAEQINFEEFCVKLQRCPRLEMLVLKGALLSDSLLSVIDFCTVLRDVKILKFHLSSFTDRLPREEFGVTSKIEVLDLTRSFLGFSNVSPFSKMPHLKELWLYNTNVNDSWFEDDISFLNQLQVLDVGYTHITSSLFSVIQDNGINLKELFYCNILLLDHELNFDNSVFPHLKTICLRGCSTVTCEGVVSLIHSCQSLENVYVDEDVAASCVAHPFIVANKCKMEIVKFIPDCDEHRRDDYQFLV